MWDQTRSGSPAATAFRRHTATATATAAAAAAALNHKLASYPIHQALRPPGWSCPAWFPRTWRERSGRSGETGQRQCGRRGEGTGRGLRWRRSWWRGECQWAIASICSGHSGALPAQLSTVSPLISRPWGGLRLLQLREQETQQPFVARESGLNRQAGCCTLVRPPCSPGRPMALVHGSSAIRGSLWRAPLQLLQASLPAWACQGAHTRLPPAAGPPSWLAFALNQCTPSPLRLQGYAAWGRNSSSTPPPTPPPPAPAALLPPPPLPPTPASSTGGPWQRPGRRSWPVTCATCMPRAAARRGWEWCWWGPAPTACSMSHASARPASGWVGVWVGGISERRLAWHQA